MNLDFNHTQDYRKCAITKVQARIQEVEDAAAKSKQWYEDHPKPLYCSQCYTNLDYEDIEHPTIELYQICPKCHRKSVIPLRVDRRNL